MIKRLIFDVDGTLITDVSFIPPIENVLKRIDAYSEENVKLFFDGIKSYEENFNSYNVHDYLKHMGIGHFFDECYGEELIKPNVEAYLQACGNNKPSECVMIGDDIYLDIETAQKIGLNTIFVNSKNIVNENIKTVTVQSVTEIDENLINVF